MNVLAKEWDYEIHRLYKTKGREFIQRSWILHPNQLTLE
jgi:hypothetical protein